MNLLISNRALCALKFLLSTLHLKKEYNITYFGFCTPGDRTSNYKYLDLLDIVISVDSDSIYTDEKKIIEYCKKYKITHLFPGWGYLSEESSFSALLEENDITFIGPTSQSMKLLGDKIQSMLIADKLNVPMVPWSKKEILSQEVYEMSELIGFPLMIKSSESGGGKGIRVVKDRSELEEKLDEVNKETNYSRVFLMKLVEDAMHIEVQILGDGNKCRHLYTRDCSTQRRNQKLIEEGPAGLSDDIIDRLQNSAVRICEYVKYRGAGTVEFLYSKKTSELCFLEVNTRLQVEHPVSEFVTDINIPESMLKISMGLSIDKVLPQEIKKHKHVIAARINAENPDVNFAPSSGHINDISYVNNRNSWLYFSVNNNSNIISTADSQFGHVFAFGNTRDEARLNLSDVLHNIKISGNIFNTCNYIKNMLHYDDFINQEHHTQMIAKKNIVMKNTSIGLDDSIIVTLCTMTKIYKEYCSDWKNYDILLKNGHSQNKILLDYKKQYRCSYNDIIYDYEFRLAPHDNTFVINDKWILEFKTENNIMYITYDDNLYCTQIIQDNSVGFSIRINSELYWIKNFVDESTVLNMMAGKFLRYMVNVGDKITEGQPIIEIEAMKMVMKINSNKSGVIEELPLLKDSLISNGDVLMKLKLDNPTNYNFYTDDLNLTCIHDDINNNSNDKYIKYVTKKQTRAEKQTIYELIEYFNYKQKKYIKYSHDSDIIEFVSDMPPQDIGVVAVLLKLQNELNIIVFGNDMSYNYGSFGANESKFFCLLCKFCQQHKLAQVFLSCNTGAQLSINNEIKNCFKIQAENNEIKYIYLSKQDYEKYKDLGKYEKIDDDTYKITKINNDGVLNLDQAASMASEMTKSYDKTFTISFVTNYSVGIGAYLCKLSERIVQHKDSSLLLTGHKALNTVLGRDLYTSNQQIGGTNIMLNNGISYLQSNSNEDGIRKIEKWISYVYLNNVSYTDETKYLPDINSAYNTIEYVADKNTFFEVQKEWAKSVITGYIRIHGTSMGLICNNNMMTTKTLPSDPADITSKTIEKSQAGSIFYPDTSLKVSNFIDVVNRDKLNILFIANVRGFSGGTSDMYDAVLRQGASIVKSLVYTKSKVVIYLPPGSELRGGSMVVLSKSINKDKIKIWADPSARINILEPNALKTIKFKDVDYDRLYNTYNNLTKEMTERCIDIFCELHDVISKDNIIDEIIDIQNLRYNINKI